MTETLCVIPARGESTRIKGKNLVDLGGHPLIAWTIIDAILSKKIDRVVVSTDDKNIKEAALKYGAECVDRPKHLSGNITHVDTAVLDTLNQLKKTGYEPDYTVLFQCTSPFRTIEDIDRGIEKLKDGDSLLYVTENYKFIWDRETHLPINYNHKKRPRSQDKKWEYVEMGNYVSKTDIYYKFKDRLGGKILFQVVPKIWDIDIDVEDDLIYTRYIQKVKGLDINDE